MSLRRPCPTARPQGHAVLLRMCLQLGGGRGGAPREVPVHRRARAQLHLLALRHGESAVNLSTRRAPLP